MDGIVDDVYWNDSKENVSVSSECEEHEGTDCEEDTLQTKKLERVTLIVKGTRVLQKVSALFLTLFIKNSKNKLHHFFIYSHSAFLQPLQLLFFCFHESVPGFFLHYSWSWL